jgi:cytochrome oxidase Cu insertion factor (SCO1/SenC/PrrC family)
MKPGLAALLLVLLVGWGTAAAAAEKRIALDQPLALADADGKTVTSNDFPGKWLLIYFGYIHCADQCPTALSAMVEALAEIGPAAEHIQPVFITVDPERDCGAALKDFTPPSIGVLSDLPGRLSRSPPRPRRSASSTARCSRATRTTSSTTARCCR